MPALLPLLAISVAIFSEALSETARCQEAYIPPRCEIVPLPGYQVSLRIDGDEKLRWHFGQQYPRPFFYPLVGPAGQPLTRMGHPGAQNHDHHRSVWFAHHNVNGIDFWSDNTAARIRQSHWYRYRDGDDEAVMATHLVWEDADGSEVMQQDVIAALMPIDREQAPNEHAVEFQLTFRPGTGRDTVQLAQTNFGFLAVRVAKSISAYFGGGHLTNPAGLQGEPKLHETSARWMDYSGPIAVKRSGTRKVIDEGITYFDHPDNPSYPTFWHVRNDGWMGAAPGMKTAIEIRSDRPLVLRYLLHAHSGAVDLERADAIAAQFAARPGFRVRKPLPSERHRQYEVQRVKNE